MVKKPQFKVLANDKDVTDKLQKNLKSISFIDHANDKADEITISVAGEFARPNFKDELKLYLGYKELIYCGLFQVLEPTRTNNYELSIKATGVKISDTLKEKRDITYESISVTNICSQIAARNNLKIKCDLDDVYPLSIAQSGESDLHFLNRLSKDYNAIFNIKNNTLVFLKKIKENKKSDTLPRYKIDVKNNTSLNIVALGKTIYKSCKSVWHDTKDNEVKSVIVGSGTPQILNKGSFKNAAEAKLKAEALLQRALAGTISGSLSVPGQIMYAGGIIELINSLEDDGEYSITKASHTLDGKGWKTDIDFEN
jgi:phage protein D